MLSFFLELRRLTKKYVLLYNQFYRATRMHSADYAVARCLSVCPSICLSVTRWYSV